MYVHPQSSIFYRAFLALLLGQGHALLHAQGDKTVVIVQVGSETSMYVTSDSLEPLSKFTSDVKQHNQQASQIGRSDVMITVWDGTKFLYRPWPEAVRHYTQQELNRLFGTDPTQIQASKRLFREDYEPLQQAWHGEQLVAYEKGTLTHSDYFQHSAPQDPPTELPSSYDLVKPVVVFVTILFLTYLLFGSKKTSLSTGSESKQRRRRQAHKRRDATPQEDADTIPSSHRRTQHLPSEKEAEDLPKASMPTHVVT